MNQSNKPVYSRIALLLAIGIFLFAFFLRVYDLHVIPPGLWYDEAIHGLDTLQIYEQHKFPVFFVTEGHPQEPMFSYLIALFYCIFGVSSHTLRLTSAIIGTLTVVACYFVVRYWFNERMALLTTFLLAISKWHLMFSRLCFRTILTPLFCLLVFHFLYKGLKELNSKIKIRYFIYSGICMGLGMYTYLSFRLVPILVILYLLHEWFHSRNAESRWKIADFLKGGSILFVTALLVFLPLLIDYFQNPFHFFGRTEEVSVFQNGYVSGVQTILSNTVKTLGMFSIKGDPEIKHNNPGEPMLPIVLSIFLILGLIQAIRNWKELKYLIPLSWFFFFLLPSCFSIGAPNTLRTLGGVPSLCILIALGLDMIYERFTQNANQRKKLITQTALAAILLYSTGLVMYQYFHEWGRNPETAQHFNINEYFLATRMQKYSQRYDYYLQDVLANQTVIQFVSRQAKIHSFRDSNDLPEPKESSKPKVFILLNPARFSNADPQFYDKVVQKYHHGRLWGGLGVMGNPSWVLAIQVD